MTDILIFRETDPVQLTNAKDRRTNHRQLRVQPTRVVAFWSATPDRSDDATYIQLAGEIGRLVLDESYTDVKAKLAGMQFLDTPVQGILTSISVAHIQSVRAQTPRSTSIATADGREYVSDESVVTIEPKLAS